MPHCVVVSGYSYVLRAATIWLTVNWSLMLTVVMGRSATRSDVWLFHMLFREFTTITIHWSSVFKSFLLSLVALASHKSFASVSDAIYLTLWLLLHYISNSRLFGSSKTKNEVVGLVAYSFVGQFIGCLFGGQKFSKSSKGRRWNILQWYWNEWRRRYWRRQYSSSWCPGASKYIQIQI